jgi:serine phosphatase RsbU (regulator of sigma subunit)
METKQSRKIQGDALDEARNILQEPSRNMKRKIVVSINLVMGLLFALHTITQLLAAGQLPYPERDNIMLPVTIATNLGSAAYNLVVLLRHQEGSGRWDRITQWATVIVLQGVCLASVHMSPNTATSFLFDHVSAIVAILVTGVILGRGAAVVWFAVTLASIVVGVVNRGADFQYHLMTQEEVASLRALQEQSPAGFARRLQAVIDQQLVPLPIVLFGVLHGFFSLLAVLVTYFEVGILGRVLGAIPAALEKIQIAAQDKQKLAQENERLGLELDVAQRIQAMILPRQDELARCAGLEVVARMQPATEVGGDIYEVLPQPDGSTVFAIGDVTDHGLTSGIVMLMSQTALRTCVADERFDLVRSLAQINTVIFNNVQTRMGDFRNLSLSLLHHKDGRVRLAGQHEKVIVVRSETRDVELIDTTDLGCTVGLIDDIAPMLEETSFDLSPGDLVVLYTDGITEAENVSQEQYGEERLVEGLLRLHDLPLPEMIAQLFRDVTEWVGAAPIYDDITLVLIRRTHSPLGR